MKKLRKFICSILIVTMVLSMSTVAYAAEGNGNGIGETVASTMIYMPSDNATAKIPNGIEVAVKIVDDDHVKVCITNYGVDTFDLVTCFVEIWDKSGRKQYAQPLSEESIFPMFPRNNTIYVKNWGRIVISNINCFDGTDSGTVPDVVYNRN